jgi:hypothetical protein
MPKTSEPQPLLLDTHVWLWVVASAPHLSTEARGAIGKVDATGRAARGGTIVAENHVSMERPMPQFNDYSKSLVALDQDSTLTAVIAISQSRWLCVKIRRPVLIASSRQRCSNRSSASGSGANPFSGYRLSPGTSPPTKCPIQGRNSAKRAFRRSASRGLEMASKRSIAALDRAHADFVLT